MGVWGVGEVRISASSPSPLPCLQHYAVCACHGPGFGTAKMNAGRSLPLRNWHPLWGNGQETSVQVVNATGLLHAQDGEGTRFCLSQGPRCAVGPRVEVAMPASVLPVPWDEPWDQAVTPFPCKGHTTGGPSFTPDTDCAGSGTGSRKLTVILDF